MAFGPKRSCNKSGKQANFQVTLDGTTIPPLQTGQTLRVILVWFDQSGAVLLVILTPMVETGNCHGNEVDHDGVAGRNTDKALRRATDCHEWDGIRT